MNPEVIGLGVSALDILSLVAHFPAGDEVQRALQMDVQGGGPVATALATLSRLGVATAMLDALGDDWRADLIRSDFIQYGVATDHLLTRAGATSAMATILVRQSDGARAIVHYPGSAAELQPAELPIQLIQRARILHLNGRHLDACQAAIHTARAAGVLISFDGGAGRYRPELDSLLPQVDICIVAAEFARQATGETDLSRAATRLQQLGGGLVVITSGLEGSWIFPPQAGSFHQTAFPFPLTLDTTGCGDSYHGAFLFGILRGWELRRTAAFASAVAAINSQTLGGRRGLPTLDDALAFLAERSTVC